MFKIKGEVEEANGPSGGTFDDWAVMSLRDGFRAYDASADYSHSWQCSSTMDALRRIVLQSGLNITLPTNLFFYARWRFSNKPVPLEFRRSKFVWELSVGLAEAIGHLKPRQPNDKPVLIPQDVWAHGDLDWDRAELVGSGFSFANVRVLMPISSVLVADHSYNMEHQPLLARIEPSEERRVRLGLVVGSEVDAETGSGDQQRNFGRPSRKEEVVRAFHQLDKDLTWSKKALAIAIRKQVKLNAESFDETGLSQDSILGHVAELWDEFKRKT